MSVIDELNKKIENKTPLETLEYFLHAYKGKIALASSMSIEDQVITDMILSIDKNVKIFTIDTGRLPEETYSLIDRTNIQYGTNIDVYFPEYTVVEKMVKLKGPNLFYDNVDNRKECCAVRKLEPLKRALSGLDIWICGLRREQSITRQDTLLLEDDKINGLLKLNPLIGWNENDVWEYIKKNNVPYSVLYKNNYKSIGCAPCTRAVNADGDLRSGRWWWENPETKECGLHLK